MAGNIQAAIVTGGGTGVGRATALRLARQGANVLITYSKSREEAEQTAADVEQAGVKAVALKADVSDDAACREMARVAKDAFGRIDLLVNNAGTTKFALATDLEAVNADDWLRIYKVNVVGAFQAVRAVQPTMLAGGGGQVINITSVAAFAAKGSSIPYCASKGALNNLTIALARALAPKIRVNAIAPGFITGRWLEQGLGGAYEQAMSTVAAQCPLEKVSEPDDIAAAILSIVNGSPMVTGQILVCDGGMLIGK